MNDFLAPERRSAPPCADRYVSFLGIDYDGNVRRVLAHLQRHRERDPDHPLLRYLARQQASRTGAQRDALLLLHSLVNPIREYFEACEDTAALADLDRLERECF